MISLQCKEKAGLGQPSLSTCDVAKENPWVRFALTTIDKDVTLLGLFLIVIHECMSV